MTMHMLSMTKEAAAAIRDGLAQRHGGVVRWNDGTILEYLKDTGVAHEQQADSLTALRSAATPVPLEFQGIALEAINKRLAAIEDRLKEVQRELKTIRQGQEQDRKVDDTWRIGDIRALVAQCGRAVDEGNRAHIEQQRERALALQVKYEGVVNDLLADLRRPDLTREARRSTQGRLDAWVNAWLLAGVLTRDLSWRVGQERSCLTESRTISNGAQRVAGELTALSTSLPTLMVDPKPLALLRDSVREAAARLEGHVLALETQDRATLDSVLERQLTT